MTATTSAALAKILAYRSNGESFAKIARRLNHEDIKTASGRKWKAQNASWLFYKYGKTNPITVTPTAVVPPVTEKPDLRGAILATLDFKISAEKRVEMVRSILC